MPPGLLTMMSPHRIQLLRHLTRSRVCGDIDRRIRILALVARSHISTAQYRDEPTRTYGRETVDATQAVAFATAIRVQLIQHYDRSTPTRPASVHSTARAATIIASNGPLSRSINSAGCQLNWNRPIDKNKPIDMIIASSPTSELQDLATQAATTALGVQRCMTGRDSSIRVPPCASGHLTAGPAWSLPDILVRNSWH